MIDHVIDCIDWIGQHARDGRDAFLADRKTQSAVLRELQTLSESCQRLSPEAKDRHPEVFWTGIAGFRNVLTHDYMGIDLERVWAIVEQELPALRRVMIMLREAVEKDS